METTTATTAQQDGNSGHRCITCGTDFQAAFVDCAVQMGCKPKKCLSCKKLLQRLLAPGFREEVRNIMSTANARELSGEKILQQCVE